MKRLVSRHYLYLAIAFLLGVTVAIQAKANGFLTSAIENPYIASFYSVFSALVLSVVIFVWSTFPKNPLKAIVGYFRTGTYRYFALLVGVPGAILVFAQSTITPVIGLIFFSIAVVSGQTIGGVIVDLSKFGGVTKPLTTTRLIGTLLAILSAVLLLLEEDTTLDLALGALFLLPFAAGILTAYQQGAIGVIRTESDSIAMSTLVSFISSSAGLLILLVIFGDFEFDLPNQEENLLIYLGGVLGFIVVYGIGIVVSRIGVLLMVILMTLGQLTVSYVWDLASYGTSGIGLNSYLSLAVCFIAATIASLGRGTQNTAKRGTQS